jgi:hypothetical protein
MIRITDCSPNVFEATAYIPEQIDEMDIGLINSTSGIVGEDLWEAYNYNERRVLDRFVEELVVEKLVPLERVGFHDEGQNLYQRIDA